MARKIRSKNPIPTNIRVKNFRERQKKKKEQHLAQQQTVRHEAENNSSEHNVDSFHTKLNDWANAYDMSKRSLDALLSILISIGIKVPKNHRTLQKTPTNINMSQVAGGQLWYNGLKKSLLNIFSTLDRDVSISLIFSVDGLPLFNSSKIQLWPILAKIHGMFLVNFVHIFILFDG